MSVAKIVSNLFRRCQETILNKMERRSEKHCETRTLFSTVTYESAPERLRIWGLGVRIPPGGSEFFLGSVMSTDQIHPCRNVNRKFLRPKLKTAWIWAFIVSLLAGCTTTTGVNDSPRQLNQPRGFFERLVDQVTERECKVGRFSCPYGLGPAGEPCNCTDPNGVVVNGRTVK